MEGQYSVENLDIEAISEETFHSVLNINNFAAYELNGSLHVVSVKDIKSAFSLYVEDTNKTKLAPHQIIYSSIQVKNRSAVDLVPLLRPIIPKWGHLSGDSSSNSLIIFCEVFCIEKVKAIVESIDFVASVVEEE